MCFPPCPLGGRSGGGPSDSDSYSGEGGRHDQTLHADGHQHPAAERRLRVCLFLRFPQPFLSPDLDRHPPGLPRNGLLHLLVRQVRKPCIDVESSTDTFLDGSFGLVSKCNICHCGTMCRLSPCEWRSGEENNFSLLNSLWFAAGALTLQGKIHRKKKNKRQTCQPTSFESIPKMAVSVHFGCSFVSVLGLSFGQARALTPRLSL